MTAVAVSWDFLTKLSIALAQRSNGVFASPFADWREEQGIKELADVSTCESFIVGAAGRRSTLSMDHDGEPNRHLRETDLKLTLVDWRAAVRFHGHQLHRSADALGSWSISQDSVRMEQPTISLRS